MSEPSFSPDELEALIKRIFDKQLKAGDISEELFRKTYSELSNAVKDGFGEVRFGEQNYEFSRQLIHNAAVFSAFKNHQQTAELVAELTDENGGLRSYNDFKKEALNISKKYNELWLETEYNTAVRASRSAEQWLDVLETADLYPNLEYRPSGAADRRPEHEKLYGIIRPIQDSFWDTHLPPNGHGCKCSFRRTDKEPTEVYSTLEPVKGVPGNSGKSAQLFSPEHPFIKNASKTAKKNIEDKLQRLEMRASRKPIEKDARKKYGNKSFRNRNSGADIYVSNKAVVKAISQNHDNLLEKNFLMLDLDILLKEAKLVKSVPYSKDRRVKAVNVHYYLIENGNNKYYLNVIENEKGEMLFYSITDEIK